MQHFADMGSMDFSLFLFDMCRFRFNGVLGHGYIKEMLNR